MRKIIITTVTLLTLFSTVSCEILDAIASENCDFDSQQETLANTASKYLNNENRANCKAFLMQSQKFYDNLKNCTELTSTEQNEVTRVGNFLDDNDISGCNDYSN